MEIEDGREDADVTSRGRLAPNPSPLAYKHCCYVTLVQQQCDDTLPLEIEAKSLLFV